MNLKYIGGYPSVTCGGVTFVRGLPVEVDDKLAIAILKAQKGDKSPTFEEVSDV